MSTQIDIIREPGQGSRVRIEEIGKASTATLDDHYRSSARSLDLTWQLGANHERTAQATFHSLRPFANELETKTKAKSAFAGFLLLGCDGVGDLPREGTECFRFSARIFLEITLIDTTLATSYKKVIIIQKEGRRFVILAYLLSHGWRYHSSYYRSRIAAHAELRSEIGLGAAFQRISGETRRRHDL